MYNNIGFRKVKYLYPPPSRPLRERLGALQPRNQTIAFDLRTFIRRFNLYLLPIDQLPLLLLHSDETSLEFIDAKDDGKWDFVLFASSELCGKLRLGFGQEIGLRGGKESASHSHLLRETKTNLNTLFTQLLDELNALL
jgi:hypothetical protein